jgi:putative transposase
VHDKLSNGHSYKMFTVLDEYTREALCVAVRPKMNANDVLETLHPRLIKHGKPEFIRSDNGPEFIATHLQDWLKKVGIKPWSSLPRRFPASASSMTLFDSTLCSVQSVRTA